VSETPPFRGNTHRHGVALNRWIARAMVRRASPPPSSATPTRAWGKKVQDVLEKQIALTGGRMRGIRWSIPYDASEVGKHVSRFVEQGTSRDATWTAIEAFGPSRGTFESNFPVDKQSRDHSACWNAFKRLAAGASAAGASAAEKAALFHDTAARVHRIAS
jgi:hypothetical protein